MHAILKGIFWVVATAIISAAPGAAQPTDEDLLYGVSAGDLGNLIASVNHASTDVGALDDGSPYTIGETPNGIKYMLVGRVCQGVPMRCDGLHMSAYFGGGEYALEAINAVGHNTAVVNVTLDDEGGLHISRYMILDHGITFGNLKTNLEVMLTAVNNVVNDIGG